MRLYVLATQLEVRTVQLVISYVISVAIMVDETRSGLFLEGECANTRCNRAKAVIHMGHRNLSLLSDEFDCKCPVCHNDIEPIQFLFRNCMFKIEYRQHIKFGKPPQTQIAVDWKSVSRETFDLETCGLANLLALKIECIPEVSMFTLTLLKREDNDREEQRLSLSKRVCSKWRNFGRRFKRDEGELDAIEQRCLGIPEECWCRLMNEWLNEGGTNDYPITWKGVIDVLEDVHCYDVARQLEKVLGIKMTSSHSRSLQPSSRHNTAFNQTSCPCLLYVNVCCRIL